MHTPTYPDLADKVAVVTGGGGALGGAIAHALANQGAHTAVWDLVASAASDAADQIADGNVRSLGLACDATDRKSVDQALERTETELGPVDILVNAAGGSRKEATTAPGLPFFDIPQEALADTAALNYLGTVLPCQAIARSFAQRGTGVVLNIASIAGFKPLTRSVAYSNAKAAVVNFTEWLAVHMAQEYGPGIRVNALAPGFVLTEQNRFLLQDAATGLPTQRGQIILSQVPMRRYGQPHDMVGAALWLVSESSAFVTGATVPIDGGLTAFGGV